MIVLTASLTALSVYCGVLYFQDFFQEQNRIQSRIQKIILGSQDLIQRTASQRGTSVYRAKKKNLLDIKRLRWIALAMISTSFLIIRDMPLLAAVPILIITAIPAIAVYCLVAIRHRRETLIRNELPGALDLMTICLGAGLGISAAFERVANEMKGSPLGDEFRQIVNESSTGLPLEEGLRNFAARIHIPETTSLIGPIIQAYKTGSSITETFRIQAEGLREKFKMQQKERQMRIPTTVLLPMVFFIFPVIFIVILGPVIVQMAQGKFI